MKTEREWIAEMYRLKGLIIQSACDRYKVSGHTKQLESIHLQLQVSRNQGVMSKGAIRAILGIARSATSESDRNRLQVQLQSAVVAFDDEAREERWFGVGLHFITFINSNNPITEGLVETLYQLIGSSFDDLNEGGASNVC